jgi:hypothetical protein
MAASFPIDPDEEKPNKIIVHNHFNIIINVAPNTNEEKISSIVKKLNNIVERVN